METLPAQTSSRTLRFLGRPALLDQRGTSVTGLPPKALIIAALVLRSPRERCDRSYLAKVLWPALKPAQRQNNLRQLLFRIRRFEVVKAYLLFVSDEGEVGLAAGVSCDIRELLDEPLDTGNAGEQAERLLRLYRGPFLDGLRPSETSLMGWLSDQRLQLQDRFVDLLIGSTESLSIEDQKKFLRRGIEVAPGSVSLRKALMRVLIAEGSMQEARRLYRETEHVVGHGVMSAPAELIDEQPRVSPTALRQLGVPLAQLGRDQAGVPHLALLPPRGINASPEDKLLAEYLIDDVTVALTRLRSISVLASHSARKIMSGDAAYERTLSRVDFIARTKLSSGHQGGNARLTMFLERAATGDLVWGEGLSINANSGPEHFAAIANGVALTLVDQIERATLRAFQVPADAGAYGHYLLGQKALQALDLPSTRRARASFRAALASSPDFAPAHAGYSQTLVYEWLFRGRDDPDLVERARRAAERAREIDPLFGPAHQMLGRASLFAGDFSQGIEFLEMAESLNPHHADLLCEFADTLMHSSLPDRANQKIESALRLNPLAPDNYWWASAGIKFFIGEYETALTHLSRVKNGDPVLRLTAACAAMAGKSDLAKQARIRFLSIDPGFKLDEWISVLPVRDAEHRRLYRYALQKAGFN